MKVRLFPNSSRPNVGLRPRRESQRPNLPQHARHCPVLEAGSALGFLVFPPLESYEQFHLEYPSEKVGTLPGLKCFFTSINRIRGRGARFGFSLSRDVWWVFRGCFFYDLLERFFGFLLVRRKERLRRFPQIGNHLIDGS